MSIALSIFDLIFNHLIPIISVKVYVVALINFFTEVFSGFTSRDFNPRNGDLLACEPAGRWCFQLFEPMYCCIIGIYKSASCGAKKLQWRTCCKVCVFLHHSHNLMSERGLVAACKQLRDFAFSHFSLFFCIFNFLAFIKYQSGCTMHKRKAVFKSVFLPQTTT